MEKDSGQRTSEIAERKVGRMMGRNEREAERKERECGERERKMVRWWQGGVGWGLPLSERQRENELGGRGVTMRHSDVWNSFFPASVLPAPSERPGEPGRR